MIIFHFYKVCFVQTEGQQDLFDTTKKPYNSPEELLSSFFKSKESLNLPIKKVTGSGKNIKTTTDIYKVDCLRNYNNIIIITIENNKCKHTTIDKKDVLNPHHPYCHVIIDLRPSHAIIGIEKNSAFDGNTDKVARILMDGISNILNPYQKKIELSVLKKISTDFWTVVNELLDKFHDSIRQIKIDFNGDVNTNNNDRNLLIQAITSLAKKAESNAVFLVNAENGKDIKINQIHEDITQIANICLEQKEYDLSVKFKSFGLYRYGSELIAQFGTEQEILDKFAYGFQEIDLFSEKTEGNIPLIDWMDKLYLLLEGYKHEETIHKGRTTSRRR